MDNSIFSKFKDHFKQKYEQKIKKHINSSQCGKNKTKIVVLCSGCYCPPHEGHYFMMEEAIKHLTLKDYDVVMGIYSVSSDAYMNGKVKDIKITFDERQKLLESLISKNKTVEQEIIVDNFEKGKAFIDYPDLCFMYQNEFKQYNIKFAYCAGSDLLKYGLNLQFYDFADLLIIYQRDQKKVDDNIRKQKDIIVLEHEQTKSLNSSEIRQNIKQANNHQNQEQKK
ncbi:hypothetical protein ABPG74_010053 [Tetrahymena malaccensis]